MQHVIILIAFIIRNFIDSTQSQLTYHGLFTLASSLPDDSLSALFRNSHLSVLYKSSGPDAALYTLVTDQVFLHEASVVWERLEDVDGSSSTFVDSEFIRSSPAGGDYAGYTALDVHTEAMTLEEQAEYVDRTYTTVIALVAENTSVAATTLRDSFKLRKMSGLVNITCSRKWNVSVENGNNGKCKSSRRVWKLLNNKM